MFQFNFSTRTHHRKGMVSHAGQDRRDRVVLSWAEHCIECAAPSCYTSCDLFTPTETGKCRRIENGVQPVVVDGKLAVELRFKRWGKLEAQGNSTLLSARTASIVERLAGISARFAFKFGGLLARATGSATWLLAHEALFKRVNRWLGQRRSNDGALPNLLVLEVVNLGEMPVELLLSVAVDKARLDRDWLASQLPPPSTIPISLPVGETCTEVSLKEASPIFESTLPFNFSLAPLGEATPHLLVRQLEVVHELVAPATVSTGQNQQKRAPAKLVVFDLDNTLWDGVLLEGKVEIRQGIVQLFAELDERGVLLSVASKNAPDDAVRQLIEFGLHDFLLFPQVGWLPKSRSIKAIVDAIDIGIDTVIFVDDNPFERAEVAAVHPQVEVLDDDAIPNLRDHPRLQGAKTAESRSRRQMYQDTIARSQAASSFGADYLEFLKDCQLEVTIRTNAPSDVERISELVQRTNQLNFSGRKYDRAAILETLTDKRMHLVIECRDKFGSYGTVGFCIARFEATSLGQRLVIDDFMLSCRVQGKFVEQALVLDLVSRSDQPVSEVIVDFHKTDRNRPAQLVLEEIGFSGGPDGGYRLDPSRVDLSVPFMTLRSL